MANVACELCEEIKFSTYDIDPNRIFWCKECFKDNCIVLIERGLLNGYWNERTINSSGGINNEVILWGDRRDLNETIKNYPKKKRNRIRRLKCLDKISWRVKKEGE